MFSWDLWLVTFRRIPTPIPISQLRCQGAKEADLQDTIRPWPSLWWGALAWWSSHWATFWGLVPTVSFEPALPSQRFKSTIAPEPNPLWNNLVTIPFPVPQLLNLHEIMHTRSNFDFKATKHQRSIAQYQLVFATDLAPPLRSMPSHTISTWTVCKLGRLHHLSQSNWDCVVGDPSNQNRKWWLMKNVFGSLLKFNMFQHSSPKVVMAYSHPASFTASLKDSLQPFFRRIEMVAPPFLLVFTSDPGTSWITFVT